MFKLVKELNIKNCNFMEHIAGTWSKCETDIRWVYTHLAIEGRDEFICILWWTGLSMKMHYQWVVGRLGTF